MAYTSQSVAVISKTVHLNRKNEVTLNDANNKIISNFQQWFNDVNVNYQKQS